MFKMFTLWRVSMLKYRKGREQRGFEGQRGKMEWEVEYIKSECHSLGLGNC